MIWLIWLDILVLLVLGAIAATQVYVEAANSFNTQLALSAIGQVFG